MFGGASLFPGRISWLIPGEPKGPHRAASLGILRGDPGAGLRWQRGAYRVGSSSTKWVAILGHRKFCESGKEMLLFWACPEGMKLIE